MHFSVCSLLLAIIAFSFFTLLNHKNIFTTFTLPAHRCARGSCTFVSFPIPCGWKLTFRPGASRNHWLFTARDILQDYKSLFKGVN